MLLKEVMQFSKNITEKKNLLFLMGQMLFKFFFNFFFTHCISRHQELEREA